ncbi:hypothetical protein CON65_20435 [Bacillus pseudomycoides]|uniref:Uncharacterized protein n=1 Tax=Bacillus pseudomycoides TaxID=64104 RepID=A0AA91V9D8_9BACI|nr:MULTISPECIES: hypothetical protein [Bacillus]PEB50414.1 hypothetical protein COO03_22380 [Bacillus sp. AFS098217]PED80864.1 hypothetical protein CON65_20435 [Bacillus pseudomycoides]PEU11310.1 hypothetical protein CN525_22505 [Bacillus sp. AFS014408]PFW57979.1 hypothetical protein COL20_25780 [Bacillus sp. AFS075034]
MSYDEFKELYYESEPEEIERNEVFLAAYSEATKYFYSKESHLYDEILADLQSQKFRELMKLCKKLNNTLKMKLVRCIT